MAENMAEKQLLFKDYGVLWDIWKTLKREGLVELRDEVAAYIKEHQTEISSRGTAGIPIVDSENILLERKKSFPKLWEWVETYPDPNIQPNGTLHWDIGQKKKRSRSGMVQIKTYFSILIFFDIPEGTHPLWGYSGYSYNTVRNGWSYPSYLPYNGVFEFETLVSGSAENFPVHLITLVGWK